MLYVMWLKFVYRPVWSSKQERSHCNTLLLQQKLFHFSDKCQQHKRQNKRNKCETPSISIYAVNWVRSVEHKSKSTHLTLSNVSLPSTNRNTFFQTCCIDKSDSDGDDDDDGAYGANEGM